MQRVSLRINGRTDLTSSIFVTQVGEPPHIGQVHSKAYDREQEVHFLAPGLSGHILGGARGAAAGARWARGSQDRGVRVLDPVLLLHQDQLHFLFLHVKLLQRGHRGQLCSGMTWMFIFAPWRSRGPGDVEQVRCVPLALTMMMLMILLLRMMMMNRKRYSSCSPGEVDCCPVFISWKRREMKV